VKTKTILIVVVIFVASGLATYFLFNQNASSPKKNSQPVTAQPESTQKQSLASSSNNNLYDKNQWELIKYQKADSIVVPMRTPDGAITAPEQTRNIDIYLLRSKIQTSSTGADAPLYDLNFIVAKGNKILYQFTSKNSIPRTDPSYSRTVSTYFDGDAIDVKDVTNDSSRSIYLEILFTSAGPAGASTYLSYAHVLKYQPETDSIIDIASNDFKNTEVSGFTWFTLNSKILGLVVKPDPAELRACHFCESSYLYLIYQWDAPKNIFVIIKTLKSQKKYGDVNLPEMLVDIEQQIATEK